MYNIKNIVCCSIVMTVCALFLIGVSLFDNADQFNIFINSLQAGSAVVLGLAAIFISLKQNQIETDLRSMTIIKEIDEKLNNLKAARIYLETIKTRLGLKSIVGPNGYLLGEPIEFPSDLLMTCSGYVNEEDYKLFIIRVGALANAHVRMHTEGYERCSEIITSDSKRMVENGSDINAVNGLYICINKKIEELQTRRVKYE